MKLFVLGDLININLANFRVSGSGSNVQSTNWHVHSHYYSSPRRGCGQHMDLRARAFRQVAIGIVQKSKSLCS